MEMEEVPQYYRRCRHAFFIFLGEGLGVGFG